MIRFLKRNEIDDELYDKCIQSSHHSEIYALSWFLDLVCDNWGALVQDDYKVVMPIPYNRKYGIHYVFQPLWTLQLGVFGGNESDNFIDTLNKRFRYIELRLHPYNLLKKSTFYQENQKQILRIKEDYSPDFLRKDRKKDLRKAEKAHLIFTTDDDHCLLIELFKNNIGQRIPNIRDADYNRLKILCDTLINKKLGFLYTVYEKKRLVAGAFIILYKRKATILFSSTDFKYRNNGSNTFLICQVIEQLKKEVSLFDFGGSSINSIASYFKSFGAETVTYPFLKVNRLPFPLKLFKR